MVNDKHQMLIAGHTHRPSFPDDGQPLYFNDDSCVSPSHYRNGDPEWRNNVSKLVCQTKRGRSNIYYKGNTGWTKEIKGHF